MKIAIGSTKAGLTLKDELVTFLGELGYEVDDKTMGDLITKITGERQWLGH